MCLVIESKTKKKQLHISGGGVGGGVGGGAVGEGDELAVLLHGGLDLGRAALHAHEEEEEVGGGEEVVAPLGHVVADLLAALAEVEGDLGQAVALQVLEVVARLPVHARAVAFEDLESREGKSGFEHGLINPFVSDSYS